MAGKEEFIAHLQEDLAAEWAAVHRYTLQDTKRYFERAEEAEDLGLEDLEVHLEQMAADEAGHARTLRRLLGR